ncbi:MAG: hypothetical protein J6B29_01295 [Clostridia bacterium]|nr:hypothetical protein [Clostridia bacterium]
MKRLLLNKKSLLLLALAVALAFIVEFFIYSFNGIFLDRDKYELSYSPFKAEESIQLTKGEELPYRFRFPHGDVFNIRLESIVTDGTLQKPIKVVVGGYDTKNEYLYSELKHHYIVPNEPCIIKLNTEVVEDSYIYLLFSDVTADVQITSIEVNSTEGLIGLNPFRLIVFLLIGLTAWGARALKLNCETFDLRRKKHLALGILTVCLIAILALSMCLIFAKSPALYSYPLDGGVEIYSPYIQQLDAFIKGQISLDVEVPKELLELENPYDCSQRGDIEHLWDRAMYDGKYYSYFGIAPILNIYGPVYLLTGRIPSDSIVLSVYTVLTAVLTAMVIFAFVTVFKKRVTVSFIILSCFCTVISSEIFLLCRGATPFYNIAVMSALASLLAFLLLLMLGLSSRHRVARPVLLALSSLAYANLFLSRVNIALVGAFLVIPIFYFGLLRGSIGLDKSRPIKIERGIKGRILDISCLGSFVLVAVIFAFIFNYIRFDSIFEFGTNYQLTVSDISKNKISFSALPQMVYHTLIQPFSVSGSFPFFGISHENLRDYGEYLYVEPNFGLFAIPLTLGLVLAVFVLKSKKRTAFAKSLCVTLILSIVTVCVVNFSLGGALYRYTSDILLFSCLASTLLIFSFNEAFECCDGYNAILSLEKLLMTCSIFVSLCVLLSSGPRLNSYSPWLFNQLFNMFN